jgi:hypothetical protein
MKAKGINKRKYEFQAAALSIASHFLIIQFCIITFSSKHLTSNPPFIFLGAILEAQDFVSLTSKTSKLKITRASTAISVKPQKSKLDPKQITTILKPSFSKDIKKERSRFIKSYFLDESTENIREEKTREEFAEEIGVEKAVPEYKPLSLY